MPYSIVALGTSWGGLSAMTRILGALPQDFGIPIVVVQHRSKDSDRLLTQLLQDATDLTHCARYTSFVYHLTNPSRTPEVRAGQEE